MNATRSRPAVSKVWSRARGCLLGACACGPSGPHRRSLVFSSIRPIDALTSRSDAISDSDIVPGLTCGHSVVSASTSAAMSRTYPSVLR